MKDIDIMLAKANHVEKEKYPELVAELIHERYTVNDELALLNNYLSDPGTHAAEYAEYQAYRAEVKRAVKEAFDANP